MIDVRTQAADFDPGRQLARLAELGTTAVASFAAAADVPGDAVAIAIDHHPALAKNQLARIAAEAEARFGLSGLILIHRHGRIEPGQRIAFAAVAASSHGAALDALAFLADALARAPFWRREILADGSERWR